uniref:Uncharacterized protein n=1 Tax=Oryza sativa subsp. japonica TaxID=39947 RepID=Q5VNE1_ORYSJ|nr:hypothetical protein [Oryza sativa Japonica Group]
MGWSLERNIPLRSGTKWSAKIGRTNPSHFDGENGVNSRSLPLGSAAVPPRPLVPPPPAPSPSAAPSSSARPPPLIRDRRRLVRVRPPPPRPAAALSADRPPPPCPPTDRRRSSAPHLASRTGRRSPSPRLASGTGRRLSATAACPSPGAAPSSSTCSLHLRYRPCHIRDRRRLVRVRPSPPRPPPPRPCPTSAFATNRRRSSAPAATFASVSDLCLRDQPPPLVRARRHLRDRRRSSATRLRLSSARADELLRPQSHQQPGS